MFKKVLIANRGLIQANVVRAVKELGAEAITIYSSEDSESTGVRNSDRAFEIETTPTRAYLDINQIVELARVLQVDAVHPGYGFLAQNAEFISRLREAGITTIAPETKGALNLSDKASIKKHAEKAGLQVLPGSANCDNFNDLKTAATKIGYPLVIKAAYGFGGKGMRIVYDDKELQSSYDHVVHQCENFAMGSSQIFIEKYLEHTHHIEFPVLRDHQGQVILFPEQECSLQRRFQKLLVETPSSAISKEMRGVLDSAVRVLVNQLNITGFASVEFLIQGGQAYFLEVNGYIQPSHTASSMLTGVDLLKEQIRIFSGESLSIQQENLTRKGHVIAAYISAEDPENNFEPSPGKIDRFYLPIGEGIVVQTNVFSGDTVTTFYDPMIAKVMVRDISRKAALRKMQVALDEFYIDGIKTSIPLMRAVISSDAYINGDIDTSYITDESNRVHIMAELKNPENEEIACFLAALALHRDSNNKQILEAARENEVPSMWSVASRWLNRKKMDF
jgi:acetyl/propionyl-CoA carboxylase alpha subunit